MKMRKFGRLPLIFIVSPLGQSNMCNAPVVGGLSGADNLYDCLVVGKPAFNFVVKVANAAAISYNPASQANLI
jgi:hypothetical protein